MKCDVGLLLYTMSYCNPEDHATIAMVKFIVIFWYNFVFCHYACVFLSMWHPVISSPFVLLLLYSYCITGTFLSSVIYGYTPALQNYKLQWLWRFI